MCIYMYEKKKKKIKVKIKSLFGSASAINLSVSKLPTTDQANL